MKILITGGAGFIGSAVVRLAIAQGHQVVNLDALTYAACLQNVESVAQHPNYIFEHANICDLPKLIELFERHRPDAVMHLAAESHVDRSIDSPGAFIDTNITGTFNLLAAARGYWESNGRPSSFRFHHISTDEVFGSLPLESKAKFTEETAYSPRSPYAASKAASDHLVRAWGETYGLPVVLTNCSNNYGPYHFPEKLFPVLILNALAGRNLPIYGDGLNVRDWLYVEDHAEALLLVITRGQVGQTYLIGGDNERSNLSIAKEICSILDDVRPKAFGLYSDQITFVADRPGHDRRYAIDASYIEKSLNWRPKFALSEGLRLTVDWYVNHPEWWQPLLQRAELGQRLGHL